MSTRGPRRVAYLAHQAGVGSELVLPRLLSVLDRGRYEPLVVLAEEGPLREVLEAQRIAVRVLPLHWWIPATHWSADAYLAQLRGLHERAAALVELLHEEGAALVHTNTIVTLEGALAAAELGLPHVWHSRGLFGGGFPPAYAADTDFYFSAIDSLADALVCVSHGVDRQAGAVCTHVARHVVYDGFDLDAFLAQPVEPRGSVRARLGIDDDAQLVLAVGGLQRRKGQLDLVEAAASLSAGFPRFVVGLAGGANDPPYVAEIEARIAALGLVGRVRLLGFQRDVRSLLAAADLLAHPSHSEGFGLAILEAMACALPVVATACGGPEEIIEAGISGLLVPIGDRDALAAALRRVVEDPSLAAAMGAAAATRARDFQLRVTGEQMGAIYDRLLAAPTVGPSTARLRAARRVADEALTRARRAAAAAADPRAAPPPPAHTQRADSWLARLRRRARRLLP